MRSSGSARCSTRQRLCRRAGARLIAGEAGLGKTSLVEAGVAAAGDFRVLRARGIESETELAATGERVRKRRPGSGGELTPQERRVAVLVSDGLTNREVAAALFVSTNTVETHLRHLFQKLGVRSRTELAGRLRDLRDSNDPVPP